RSISLRAADLDPAGGEAARRVPHASLFLVGLAAPRDAVDRPAVVAADRRRRLCALDPAVRQLQLRGARVHRAALLRLRRAHDAPRDRAVHRDRARVVERELDLVLALVLLTERGAARERLGAAIGEGHGDTDRDGEGADRPARPGWRTH